MTLSPQLPTWPKLGRVSALTTVLFLLLFTGPPKFRVREAEASLYGELDAVLVFQVLVWLVAGAWVALQLWRSYRGKQPPLQFTPAQRIALALIAVLGVGTITSLAVPLTAFKVYQVAVEFFFCLIFIEWYGVEKFLDLLLAGYLLLCTIIGACALIIPDFVFSESETGGMRLEGRLIAEASTVAALTFILLFGRKRKLSGFWFWLGLSALILVASVTRNAWIAVALFIALAIWRRPRLPHIKVVYALGVLAFLAVLLGGLSELNKVRDPANIYTLSDRLGLWAYLSDAVLGQSPMLGLGYVAGSRVLGPEYNPGLGSAHSIFFEVFVGGGFAGLSIFLVMLAVLGWHSWKLLAKNGDSTHFTVIALFAAVLLMGTVGGELDSTSFSFTFWGLVSALPLLRQPAYAVSVRTQTPIRFSAPLTSNSSSSPA